ncbi:hypothetical protein SADUNF_Sadunf12G0001800 [Salix dunnii]|uniref:Leucine-rich repeat-containing N-terminal plant-type domain-containing protein n=1 Tax=Salix dunnii TaxID=1413687 RepID=A0A835JQ19_9ROSI|nr:hypothetical protein SADUNF_Sadunf12G0001800 [Salix dunnii]
MFENYSASAEEDGQKQSSRWCFAWDPRNHVRPLLATWVGKTGFLGKNWLVSGFVKVRFLYEFAAIPMVDIWTTISSSNYYSPSHSCAHDQSLSLLQFKASFSINSSASGYCQHPKTESWKEGTDCCLWDGVTCEMKTGFVTGLHLACSLHYGTLHSNSTLFSLCHLRMLDLSDNHFRSSHISPQFGQLSNLTHLTLSLSGFAGQVPSEISLLSKLVSLDLSANENPSLEPA